ncbi:MULTISPECIES: FecR family protein [Parabacteroides]|jgi:transmembrane sensor|uniref:FecR protein domain-containing protein n=1 Tax=Parabacteroides gordonii MS-1 = DSM 23371 TaxID=1203610 RepID=A0A0F5JLW0_9BACT|nr:MULTISPECIES: FecR family protein [Parabacteroides]KKB46414.1 hypothetical protein HMPREF1212_03908 [Parabacteroides sp. HGS0025]KKB58540.1 hypothetical protein HMPREF1536_01417 [Parabacteroides gordonii MS-1 = DSM 23371]MCA5583199.1 FecR family protein [Parabacteroides gordonii]RGP17157.1 FecR family protein [Parabacteroides gordonii]
MDQELIKKYITGWASEEEKMQVLAWAKSDKRNMSELQAMHKLYNVTLWQQRDVMKGRKKTTRLNFPLFTKIASVAAVFLLLLSMSWYIFDLKRQLPETAMQTISVPPGQRVELTLADGTNVWLNAGTTFTFPNNFSSDDREVELNGEGYFTVSRNEKKPFIVKTSTYNIKVLGTEFNVMAYAKAPMFEVALLNGSVEVYSETKHQKVLLEPNTQVHVENDRLVKGPISHFDNLLWKDGVICFDDEPVDRMIEKLELYFDTRITVENEAFKKKRYTGKFQAKKGIEHILNVFQLKDRFVYEKDEENNTITIK